MSGTRQYQAAQAPLFRLNAANMQSTADQSFTKLGTFTNYIITKVVAVNKTGGTSVACVGGIYTAAAKGGSALVAAAQSWLNLTALGKIVDGTIAAVVGTDIQTATPILSLTTGSTAASTADILIFGQVLD